MRYRTWFSALCALTLIIAACGGDGAATTTAAGEDNHHNRCRRRNHDDRRRRDDDHRRAGGVDRYAELDQAMAGEFSGTTVEIVAQWVRRLEADNFDAPWTRSVKPPGSTSSTRV